MSPFDWNRFSGAVGRLFLLYLFIHYLAFLLRQAILQDSADDAAVMLFCWGSVVFIWTSWIRHENDRDE